ncbi:hypothetical protein CA850_07360 [Micromonospora echinospora]|nr:hypothetical protein CA850_07360 [Micromonospora echinospora]
MSPAASETRDPLLLGHRHDGHRDLGEHPADQDVDPAEPASRAARRGSPASSRMSGRTVRRSGGPAVRSAQER